MRRTSILLALVLSFVLAGSALAEPLKISMPTWVGNGPLFLAQEKGFYEAEGVDVELSVMDDISMRFAAYYGGQIDGMSTTISAYILNVKPDQLSKVVLLLDDSKGGDGIVANKDITSMKDLKGKKVAYKESSVSEWFLAYLLMENGMSEKDIESVNMEPGGAGTAFIAGQVDAAVTWEPYLTKGKNAEHGHLLIDSSETPGLISDVLIFPASVIEKRSDDIAKVCRAVVQAVEYWKEHPDEANAIMAKAIGGWLKDPALFAETLTGIQYYDREMNKKTFANSIQEMVADRIRVWNELGKMSFTPEPSDLYDKSFAEKL